MCSASGWTGGSFGECLALRKQVRERQISYDITYMQTPLKTNTMSLITKQGWGFLANVTNSHSGGLLSSVTPAPTRWCTSARVGGSCCLALGSDRHCLSVQFALDNTHPACTPSIERLIQTSWLWWLVSSEEITERQQQRACVTTGQTGTKGQ